MNRTECNKKDSWNFKGENGTWGQLDSWTAQMHSVAFGMTPQTNDVHRNDQLAGLDTPQLCMTGFAEWALVSTRSCFGVNTK